MPDAHKNFARSTVATAPSPATTGTSLVVAAGEGALFPTPPFNATIWPAGERPLASTAEIVRVTAIATDTLTITREQEGTTARTIIAGDQIAATITNKTLTDIEIVYNVKAYGATGDGTTDDSAAFASAVTAANGATVFVPVGTYIVENLDWDIAGSKILGAGRNAILKLKPTPGTPFRIAQIDAANMVIDSLAFDCTNGSSSNATCLRITGNGSGAIVRGCWFLTPRVGGVYIEGACSNILIEGNHFSGDGYGVLTQDASTVSKLVVSHNTFTGGSQGDAVEINTPTNGATDVSIVNNTISGYQSTGANSGFGIGVSRTTGILISGNTIQDCKNKGVHVERASQVSIVGNYVRDCGKSGIGLNSAEDTQHTHDIAIIGNTVLNCAADEDDENAGIICESSVGYEQVVILGNVVRGCGNAASTTAYGIYTQSDALNLTVAWNIVSNTTGVSTAGIRINKTTNGIVAFNRCFDDQGTPTQLYGLRVHANQTDTRYFSNDLSGNATGRLDISSIGVETRNYGLWDDGDFAGHLANDLALGTGAEIFQYNTADETTNYERLEAGWGLVNANSYEIRTAKGGTGTARNLRFLLGGSSTTAIIIQTSLNAGIVLSSGSASTATTSGRVSIANGNSNTSTSGESIGLRVNENYAPTATSTMVAVPVKIQPTINYSNVTPGAGSYEALKISVIETALPTGTNYVIRCSTGAAGTTDVFTVDRAGDVAGASASGTWVATQAEQETGTATTKIVTPGRQHFHPSAAKFWVTATGNSTTILASYNMTSWADTGLGDADGTIATDFSSADWCGTASVMFTGGSAWDATFTTGCGFDARAAGTFGVLCSKMQDGGTAAAALVDPTTWCVVGFGDHA